MPPRFSTRRTDRRVAGALAQFLNFEVAGQRLALPAADIREVVARRRLTPVPQSPASLLGVTNLRGTALPVLSLATLLDRPEGSARRILVLDGAAPVGLAVDTVLGLMTGEDGDDAPQRIDVAPLIARSFTAMGIRSGRRGERVAARRARAEERAQTRLLSFVVGDQAFALPLDRIDGVVPLGDEITKIPDAEAAVLGLKGWRGGLLPLLSLSVLLGRAAAAAARPRVIIVAIEGHRVGLVVDAIGEVIAVPATDIDPVPPILLRGGGEARIAAIARLDGGRRLLSLLATDMLVDPETVARLRASGEDILDHRDEAKVTTQALLRFTLGGQSYGLPLTAIDEVTRLPERLTPLPRALDFVRGIVHLRGRAVAVIDQGARFGEAAGGRQLIVARAGGLEAAFLVDRVCGVVRVPATALLEAPATGDDPQLFETLLDSDGDSAMTLLLSPFALLARTQRDMLVALGSGKDITVP